MYPIDLSSKKGVIALSANSQEGGVNWAIAQVLSEAGARLAFILYDEGTENPVARLISSVQGALLVPCADLTKEGFVATAFSRVKEEFGEISFLVHGGIQGEEHDNPDMGDFYNAVGFRPYTLMVLMKYAAPLMLSGGSVVTIMSEASHLVYPGSGLAGMAEAVLAKQIPVLAAEHGKQDIRVNGILVGSLNIDESETQKAPLKRAITPDDVAGAALYLCSDLSSATTGAVIPVTGGRDIMAV